MMKKYLPALFLVLFSVMPVRAQYEQVWVFGDSAGIDFNTGSPIAVKTAIKGGERTASICDAVGNLLFYTSGDQVWDRSHQLMPNGDTLITDPTMPGTGRYCNSTSQASLIVPSPGDPFRYYLFSLTAMEFGVFSGRLYYSIIDLRLNNGMGDVDVSHKSILLDSNLTEHLTGVSGDRCNSWVIAVSSLFSPEGAVFKSFEITDSGINPDPVLSVSPLVTTGGLPLGKLEVSADGRKVAICRRDPWGHAGYGVEVYDFNRANGHLLNGLSLSGQTAVNSEAYYGVAFSQDNSKVYASGAAPGGLMVQYDLSSNDPIQIAQTKTFIDSAHDLRRAPDGKIYYKIVSNTTQNLGVLHFPDLAGLSCQPARNAVVPQPNTFYGGFPNLVPVVRKDTFLNSQNLSAGCFAVQTTISANGSEGWDYVWSTGQTGNQLTVDTPGMYWVTYFTPPCNFHADTFHVAFPAGVLPTLDIQGECRDYRNGQVYAGTYPGDPVLYTYTWLQGSDTLFTGDSLQNVPSGAYRVHVQTSTGCDTLLHFELPEEDFRVSFTTSDTLVCLGDTVLFQNTSDSHFTSFYWDFTDGNTSTAVAPSYRYVQSGTHPVVLSGVGPVCRDTARVVIHVDPSVTPGFTAEPTVVCLGQAVYFYPVMDSTTIAFEWLWGDQIRSESRVQDVYQHAFDAPGTFPVAVKMQFRACPDTSFTDSIIVYPLPEVDLGGDSSICLDGGPIYLKNLRPESTGMQRYLWSTGDTTSILKVVRPGMYSLSVSSGPLGCSTTEQVVVRKSCAIDIPNAFTPNGDGHNDYFFPRQLSSEGVTAFHLQVFNRWGQLLFETRELNGRGWNGRLNDEVQPMGVYLYRIDVRFANSREERYEGNVTLLR